MVETNDTFLKSIEQLPSEDRLTQSSIAKALGLPDEYEDEDDNNNEDADDDDDDIIAGNIDAAEFAAAAAAAVVYDGYVEGEDDDDEVEVGSNKSNNNNNNNNSHETTTALAASSKKQISSTTSLTSSSSTSSLSYPPIIMSNKVPLKNPFDSTSGSSTTTTTSVPTTTVHQALITKKTVTHIADPNENDVLCGRRAGNYNHAGNVQFRDNIHSKKKEYQAPSTKKHEKASIVSGIVNDIRTMDPPGRFLKEDKGTGLWFDIGEAKAREKTSQALREASASPPATTTAGNQNDDCNNNNNCISKKRLVGKMPEKTAAMKQLFLAHMLDVACTTTATPTTNITFTKGKRCEFEDCGKVATQGGGCDAHRAFTKAAREEKRRKKAEEKRMEEKKKVR